jgi:phospholipid/cholesterol/gamma-HCH transport system substrate-binding protein
MKIRTEIKIGLIVLITLAFIVWGINYLKGRNVLKRSDVYYAVYNDIAGLKMSASVILSGYKVGMINDIAFMNKNLDKVIVAFYVNSEYKIPVGSIAQIYSSDIMGNMVIRIIPTKEKRYYEIGDTLASAVEEGIVDKIQSQIKPLLVSTQDVILHIDTMISSINNVLDPETQKKLKESVSNLESASSSLSQHLSPGGTLDKTFVSLEEFTLMLDNNKDKLSNAFGNLESISDSVANANLKQTLSNIDITFNETRKFLEKINKGEGSLGLLASSDSLYNNLQNASANLSFLLDDMNKHPKRYVHFSVFGKKDK